MSAAYEEVSVAPFEAPKAVYQCLYECGRTVDRPGYACDACSEAALPFELQRRPDDEFLLIRNRPLLAGPNKGEDGWVVLRPKNQPEGNGVSGAKAIEAAAEHLRNNFSFSKSAEGKAFWEGLVNMLHEKAAEMLAAKKKS